MQPGITDATPAIERASAHLADQHLAYQTTLVAATELMADPESDPNELRILSAELRIIERDMTTVKSDIRALSQLTNEEVKMSVADRIAAEVAEKRKQAGTEQAHRTEEKAQRLRLDDQANDRETPAHQEEMDDERTAHDVGLDDQDNDRDGGTRSMSLQERIAAEAEKIKAARDGKGRDETNGRSR